MTKRAELHTHSHIRNRLFYCPLLYDAVQSVETILEKATELNIKILSITDHDSLKGYLKAKEIIKEKALDIIFVPGAEISSKDGHILAYGINKPVKKGLTAAETVSGIHEQGGIAVAAHLYSPNLPFFTHTSLGDEVFEADFDAIETPDPYSFRWAATKSLEAAKKLNLPTTVGSDAHQPEEIGKNIMYFPESTKNWQNVIENIKRGNFKTSTSKMSVTKMALRHLKRNFEIQILKRGV